MNKGTPLVATEQLVRGIVSDVQAADVLSHAGRPAAEIGTDIQGLTDTAGQAVTLFALAEANRTLGEENSGLATQVQALRNQVLALQDEIRHESMTGLLTKAAFLENLQQMINESQPCLVMVADLMSLKAINDTLGHEDGDMIIQETAQVLNFGFTMMNTLSLLGVPHSISLGRLGGDEFGAAISFDGLVPSPEHVAALLDEEASLEEHIAWLQTEDPERSQDPEKLAFDIWEASRKFETSKHVLSALREGTVNYHDIAGMLYMAIQELYRDEYLASADLPDLGQGIATGFAIYNPQNDQVSPEAGALLHEADSSMYADKARQQEDGLGKWDRRTKTRLGANSDRRIGERRKVERRGQELLRSVAKYLSRKSGENDPERA